MTKIQEKLTYLVCLDCGDYESHKTIPLISFEEESRAFGWAEDMEQLTKDAIEDSDKREYEGDFSGINWEIFGNGSIMEKIKEAEYSLKYSRKYIVFPIPYLEQIF